MSKCTWQTLSKFTSSIAKLSCELVSPLFIDCFPFIILLPLAHLKLTVQPSYSAHDKFLRMQEWREDKEDHKSLILTFNQYHQGIGVIFYCKMLENAKVNWKATNPSKKVDKLSQLLVRIFQKILIKMIMQSGWIIWTIKNCIQKVGQLCIRIKLFKWKFMKLHINKK